MSSQNAEGTTTPAPVDHTWAHIVAAMTTSADITGTSDVVNMGTPRITGGGGDDVLRHRRWPKGARNCLYRRPAAYL
jgi:hypothetical protein